MTPDAPTWALVATLREPAALVLGFAAHHLALGAAEVHLYFDDPDDPAADLAVRLPRTRVTRCDAAYWARIGGRPDLQTGRQQANAEAAQAATGAEWLLHCDADEFLVLRRPLAEDLKKREPGQDWLRVQVAERVWIEGQRDGLFDGAFRRPLEEDAPALDAVYGGNARFLARGLAGHAAGKGMLAVRSGLRPGIHAPSRPGVAGVPPARNAWHATILHFDGLTPRLWADKTLRYAAHPPRALEALQHPARRAQIAHVRDACPSLAEVLDFHRSLFRLSLDQAAELDAAKGLLFAHLDPAAALARLWPGPDPAPALTAAALTGG